MRPTPERQALADLERTVTIYLHEADMLVIGETSESVVDEARHQMLLALEVAGEILAESSTVEPPSRMRRRSDRGRRR